MFQTAAGVTVSVPRKSCPSSTSWTATLSSPQTSALRSSSDFVHSFYAELTSRCSPSIRMQKAMRSGIWTA